MSAPSDTAIKTLFALSRNLCFFGPDESDKGRGDRVGACEQRLTDPSWKRVKARIAHIKGEHPNSARYDAAQPDSERQGFENLMLLCPNHHTEIDDLRPDDFPPERLVAMRARHLAASSGGEIRWCTEKQAAAFATDAIAFFLAAQGTAATVQAVPGRAKGAMAASAARVDVTAGGTTGATPVVAPTATAHVTAGGSSSSRAAEGGPQLSGGSNSRSNLGGILRTSPSGHSIYRGQSLVAPICEACGAAMTEIRRLDGVLWTYCPNDPDRPPG